MDRWQYLSLLGLCVLVTLPLEIAGGARVYRRPGRLITAVVPVAAMFGGWDLLGTHQGDWWYSTRYTLGWRLLGLPVEEWLFFLVVPVCAVLTYEILDRIKPDRTGRSR
jgi:lycopene cyclase domain-containing protein